MHLCPINLLIKYEISYRENRLEIGRNIGGGWDVWEMGQEGQEAQGTYKRAYIGNGCMLRDEPLPAQMALQWKFDELPSSRIIVEDGECGVGTWDRYRLLEFAALVSPNSFLN